MKRREIIAEAKMLVAYSGAYSILDSGTDIFLSSCPTDDPRRPYTEAIVTEAYAQAHRVLEFLGFQS